MTPKTFHDRSEFVTDLNFLPFVQVGLRTVITEENGRPGATGSPREVTKIDPSPSLISWCERPETLQ